MPTFSIIIPTYNRQAFLKAALDSVWQQTSTDFEVIVVDDGSVDGTREYLDSLGGRIVTLSQRNQGPGAARNNGTQLARGEYLAFLDSDDLWFPWTLSSVAELILRHHRPAILSASVFDFACEGELVGVSNSPVNADTFKDFLSSHRTGYFVGAGMLIVQRSAFLRVGGFTNRRLNLEDHDLVLRLGEARGFVQINEPKTLGLRRHAESETRNLHLSVEGSGYLIDRERSGVYPGGSARIRERRQIITRHLRPVILSCLNAGLVREAWQLYQATLMWHIGLGRWRFLLAAPLLALSSWLRLGRASAAKAALVHKPFQQVAPK